MGDEYDEAPITTGSQQVVYTTYNPDGTVAQTHSETYGTVTYTGNNDSVADAADAAVRQQVIDHAAANSWFGAEGSSGGFGLPSLPAGGLDSLFHGLGSAGKWIVAGLALYAVIQVAGAAKVVGKVA